MKRFLAIVLCLVMVLSSAVAAFASTGHNHTIEIHNSHEGYVYKAYQIFSGDLASDGVLSNVTWGSGVDGAALLAELQTLPAYAACTDASDVAKALANAVSSSMDDPIAIEFAEIAEKYVVEAEAKASVWDDTNKIYNITGLEDGYYLVVNSDIPDEANTTFSRYIMEVVRDIAVTHKGTFPTVDKDIIDASLELDENEASIGEDVVYQIEGTIPTNIADYVTYYYAFRDTLSKGLTYNNDMIITVNGVDVTDYFYIEASAYSETEGTEIYVGIQDLLALENSTDADGNALEVGEITHATKVVVTYSAEVNENALIGVEGNPNKVRLEYDNDPNEEGVPELPPPNPDKPVPPSPVGVTPEVEVNTYVTELTILKKDGTGAPLTGAEFTLSGEAVKKMIVTRETFAVAGEGETPVYWELNDGTFTDVAPVLEDDPDTTDIDERTIQHYKTEDPTHVIKEVQEIIEKTESVEVKAFVGEDGYVTFTGLGAGEYTLTESVTPAGFNTIDPITFTIEFDTETCTFSCENSWIMVEADNTLYAEIVNVAGSTLPSTGGIGTTIFYIIGGILFAGALVFLVTKKRMSE